jgi:hypothetical protein
MDTDVRKVVLHVEEVRVSGGVRLEQPLRISAAAAVVANPHAGRFVADLGDLADRYCETLGSLLSTTALDALAGPVEAYGKGALVGMAGEVEHGSAIIHNLRFGDYVRRASDGSALLPSAEKRGAAGAPIDLALKHKDDHSVRSHHQTFEVRVADAPADDEIVIWVALATGGRPHARLPEFASELRSHPV